MRGRDFNKVNEASDWIAQGLQNAFRENVLGPEFPPVARIRNQYYKIIMLKIPGKQSLVKTKQYIQKLLKSYESIGAFRSVRVIINVDPY